MVTMMPVVDVVVAAAGVVQRLMISYAVATELHSSGAPDPHAGSAARCASPRALCDSAAVVA